MTVVGTEKGLIIMYIIMYLWHCRALILLSRLDSSTLRRTAFSGYLLCCWTPEQHMRDCQPFTSIYMSEV